MEGKTVIELFDTGTGAKVHEQVEGNMFTNAFRDMVQPLFVLPFNVLGCSAMTDYPRDVLLSGLLAFDTALAEDPDKYYPPAGVRMTAHGGFKQLYTGTDQTKGSYNINESGVQADGGYKHVWDFTANQGNGRIASVCLTTEQGGICGYGSETPTEASSGYVGKMGALYVNPLMITGSANIQGNSHLFLNLTDKYFVSVNPYVALSGRLVGLYKIGLPMDNVSILKRRQSNSVNYIGADDYSGIKEINIDLSGFFSSISNSYGLACVSGEYLYIIVTNSSSSTWAAGEIKKILKISLTDFTVQAVDVTNTTGASIPGMTSGWVNSLYNLANIAVHNDYLYVVDSNKKVYAINLSDSNDVRAIKMQDGSDYTAPSTKPFIGVLNERVYLGTTSTSSSSVTPATMIDTSNFTALYTAVYSAYMLNPAGYADNYSVFIPVKHKNKIYTCHARYATNTYIYLAYNAAALMTINNISPVVKTPAQSMRITYTVSPE